MDSADNSAPDGRYLAPTVDQALKILVVGSFGVGKTTLVGSVSEIDPLRTEETITQASSGVDDLSGLSGKTATTVAMDFGRITLNSRMVLYLFGTPGQKRFWDLWEGLVIGSIGLLVLVDTRRIEDSFEILDQLDVRNLPFAVAINQFPDSARYDEADLREALDLLPETPLVHIDARSHHSSTQALITLVEYAARIKAQEKVA